MIIPAILEKTSQGFAEKLERIKTIPDVKRIQVDFCDGLFVESQSLPVKDLPKLDDKHHFEAHLMVQEPTDFDDYKAAGFRTIIVHYEGFNAELHMEAALELIKNSGLTPGLAINPETPISMLRYFTDTIKHFTVLSVHPGRQGSPFLPESYERVRELRSLAPDATIEVDGGVNSSNAKILMAAGATDLVVGSALYETEITKQNYQKIVETIK